MGDVKMVTCASFTVVDLGDDRYVSWYGRTGATAEDRGALARELTAEELARVFLPTRQPGRPQRSRGRRSPGARRASKPAAKALADSDPEPPPSRTTYARRLEAVPFDELPRGVAVALPVEGRGERCANGQFATGARTWQAAGGRATRNLRHAKATFESSSGDGGERAELERLAKRFRKKHLREVARGVGGGQCPHASVDLIAAASMLYAWSGFLFKTAARSGDVALVEKARHLADSWRVKLVAAYGFAADAAEARKRGAAATATSSWLALQPRARLFPSRLLRGERRRRRTELVALAAGADFGFRVHSSALAVVGRDVDGVVWIIELAQRKPRRGVALKPATVASDFAVIVKRHGVSTIAADLFYIESMREHFATSDLEVVATDAAPGAMAMRMLSVRELLESRRLRHLDRRICAELAKVHCKLNDKGAPSIILPRGEGGHGDLVVALAAAIDALPPIDKTGNA